MRLTALAVSAGLFAIASTRSVPLNATGATWIPLDDIIGPDLVSNDTSEVSFSTCKGTSAEQSLFEVEEIHFSPNPPQTNRNLDITVRGHLKQDAEEGSIMKVSIKTGIVTLKRLRYDFCEGVNTTCPVKAGEVAFRKEQWIDRRIPTSWAYKIKVEVYSKEKQRLGCVDIPVKLSKPPKSS